MEDNLLQKLQKEGLKYETKIPFTYYNDKFVWRNRFDLSFVEVA